VNNLLQEIVETLSLSTSNDLFLFWFHVTDFMENDIIFSV